MNYQQAREIRKDFAREYLQQFGDSVSTCNLLVKWSNPPQWTIYLRLKKELPQGMHLPETYRGLNVRVEVGGKK